MVIVLPANNTLLNGVFAILLKGESQVDFTIHIIDDNIPEFEEVFSVALIPESYIVGEMSAAQIYIQDDDGEWRMECCGQLTSLVKLEHGM